MPGTVEHGAKGERRRREADTRPQFPLTFRPDRDVGTEDQDAVPELTGAIDELAGDTAITPQVELEPQVVAALISDPFEGRGRERRDPVRQPGRTGSPRRGELALVMQQTRR